MPDIFLWRAWRVVISVMLFLHESLGQYQCPGLTYVKVCDQCPNQCNGPVLGSKCTRNGPDANYLKCAGASWGNTLSTYMGLSCSAPSYAVDNYPIIPVLSPVYSAPLKCNGTVLRGLWPYDEDNMTFSIDTMYRDPRLAAEVSVSNNQTTGVLNSLYLGCVSFRLRPLAALSESEGATGELAACTLSARDLADFNYVGLNLMVCVNTNPTLDPTCQQGQWLNVINGACVQENVFASVALQDYGDRLLVRVGGPGNLTACQPRWELEIERTGAVCFTSDEGYGSCCQLTCIHGARRTQTCFCDCLPGFTGVACDVILPYIETSLVLSNTTLSEWVAFSHAETNGIQADNAYRLRSVLAELLGLEINYIEFAWAESNIQATSRRSGRGGLSDAAEEKQEEEMEEGELRRGGRPRRTLLQSDPRCAVDNFGSRVTAVSVRIVQAFEHNLFALNRRLQRVQGNITAGLAQRFLYVCLVRLTANAFTTYAAPVDLTAPQLTPPGGVDQGAILLAVCVTVGVLIILIFFSLHFCTELAEQRDRTRYLREYKPILAVHKQGNAWRHEDPVQRLLVAYPGSVSAALQRGFLDGWIGRGEATFQFSHRDKDYEADFATMSVKETPREGEIVDVPDSCSVRLDSRASAANQQYDGFAIVITAAPPGADPDVVGQRRRVVSYLGGRTRLVTVANPFLPVPIMGCRYKLEWPAATAYRLVPPGLELEDAEAMAVVPSRNPKLQEQILRRAHAAARGRLDRFVFYPGADPAPPAAGQNLPRLRALHSRDMEARRAAAAEAAGGGAAADDDDDADGVSSTKVRETQLKAYHSAIKGDADYNRLVERVRESKAPMDKERQLLDRAFRSEIFEPGSSVRVIHEEKNLAVPAEPSALRAMKQWRLRSLVDPGAAGRGAVAGADRRMLPGLGPNAGEDLSYLAALPDGRAAGRRDGVEEEVAV